MNKATTLLILLVIFAAMGLIVYSHNKADAPSLSQNNGLSADNPVEDTKREGFTPSLQTPQGSITSGTLLPIEPPIGTSFPSNDGVPKPVTLSSGSDAKIIQPSEAASGQSQAQNDKPIAPLYTPVKRTNQEPEDQKSSPGPVSIARDAVKTKNPGQQAQVSPKETKPADPVAGNAPLSATGTHSLRSINLSFSGQHVQLRIEAGDPFPVKTFALAGPDRLVIDLPGTWTDMKAPDVPKNNVVDKVRLGNQPAGPRLVLDLKGPLKNHSVERDGNRVDVMVR